MGLSQQDVAALSSTRPRLTAYSLAKLTHASMSKGGSVGASVGGSVGIPVSVKSVAGTDSVGAGSVGSAVDGNVDDGRVGTGGEVDVCASVGAWVMIACCDACTCAASDGAFTGCVVIRSV